MRHEFCGSELRKRATAAVSFLGQAGGVHVDARARAASRHRPAAPRDEAGVGATWARDGHGRGRYVRAWGASSDSLSSTQRPLLRYFAELRIKRLQLPPTAPAPAPAPAPPAPAA